jgi:luciferase family oxidoreductase group 1
MTDISLSALEAATIQTGSQAADALRDTAAFAQEMERLGFHRVWYAEFHHSPSVGAFPPVVLAAHSAALTSTIRLGSGGVLAPNHAPILLAEQFGTLAALHPGRIDLGIGRGPGTFDQATLRALRRSRRGSRTATCLCTPPPAAEHRRGPETVPSSLHPVALM